MRYIYTTTLTVSSYLKYFEKSQNLKIDIGNGGQVENIRVFN